MHGTEPRLTPSRLKLGMLGAVAITLVACTRAAGGATPGIETAAPAQTTATSAPVSSEVIVSESPSMDAGEFWARFGGGENAESYDSLGSIIRAADLVVVGEVTEFRDGRRIVFPETNETMYMVEVRVRVDDTLRGSLISPDDAPGTVVVETSIGFGPNPLAMAELEASTPVGSRVVLFLLNTNAAADRNGSPPDAPYRGEIYYLLPNGTQSAITDVAGAAGIGPGAEDWPWLAKFKGQPFDRVVQEIQTAASNAP